MLNEQDIRAVEAMVRSNIEIDELCMLFPNFNKNDIMEILIRIQNENHSPFPDNMHSVSRNCS